ncbi:hypothetical protein Mapa_013754 [Marchantia paleacea]|nr:hypothetical protein Mapa_013754 [Marchantia paleacea]
MFLSVCIFEIPLAQFSSFEVGKRILPIKFSCTAMELTEESAVPFPAFPFEPYPIQLQFMNAVYSGIQKGGVTIVESPTGTGKTLSLICSTLQWLIDQHEGSSDLAGDVAKACNSVEEEPDWMSNFEAKKEEEEKKRREARKRTLKARLAQNNLKRTPGNGSVMNFGGVKASKEGRKGRDAVQQPLNSKPSLDEDDHFIVDDYCSDEEAGKEAKRKQGSVDSSSSDDNGGEISDDEEPLKVFFCSRTHSQLSQFVGELQRTVFSSSLRSVSLGSRKNLCINPAVAALGNSARINDKCLELQKEKQNKSASRKLQSLPQKGQKKVTTKGGCPMMSKQKLQTRYVEEVLEAGALDIEDLVDLGSKIGTCPYYGSRRMVPISDLVVLPYQSLLHAGTRETLGINLKNCVVVIDEAHNLVDTVSDIHSCQVTKHQLKQVNSQLSEYLDKFRRRLAASNRRYIEMLLVLIGSIMRFLSSTFQAETGDARMMTINDFVFSLGIDNLNLFKIRRYIKVSNIVHKVSSYGEKYLDQVSTGSKAFVVSGRTSVTGFHMLAEFILALTNADTDGRVILMPKPARVHSPDSADSGSLKFVMLNAAKYFAEVLEQARAVILAGGTLQPVEELRVRLFPHLPEDRMHVFSCGHIVPPESILALAIGKGPNNRTFDFTYQSRSTPAIIEELGILMKNICTVVPEGIVLFFPSFEYEAHVFNSWQSAGTISAIEAKKSVFREPRDGTALEDVLRQYRECISKPPEGKKTGAVLMCVVGGKMSEGINFSDGMGRCVVMVGLPYPSPNDAELVERMKYIDSLSSADPQGSHGGKKSREYYENLCMKAVNQSIGRAIRHIKDYAAILLVDARYSSDSSGPSSKLPGWIGDRLVKVTGSFGEVHKRLHQFFRYNRLRDQHNANL